MMSATLSACVDSPDGHVSVKEYTRVLEKMITESVVLGASVDCVFSRGSDKGKEVGLFEVRRTHDKSYHTR